MPEPLAPGARVGVVGLGRMGGPIATRLAAAGYAVTAFDLDAAAVAALPVDAAPTPRGVADGAAAVILMLPSSAIVRRVLLDDGLLRACAPGTLLIDMGSSEPQATRELAAAAATAAVAYVDAPVSGGVAGARAGTLTIMAGGAEGDVAAAAPAFAILGETVLHVGSAGCGHALKALNNLLSATSLLVSCEALEAGRRFGLDPATMLEAINASSGRSFSTEVKLPRFVVPADYRSGFALELMLKDMRIALGLADAVGVDARLATTATDLWAQAARELEPTADHTEIGRWTARDRPTA